MSKRQILMLLGAWIMILLFLGFPSSWDKVIALFTGLAVVIISYKMPPQPRQTASQNNSYVEHKPISSDPSSSN